jgi:multidrug efflux pump subunit AcrA (membrane-fusion protein)
MIILLLIVLISLVPGCSNTQSQPAPPAGASASVPALAIEAAPSIYREIVRFVEAVGTLDPNQEVTVSNQVEGTVMRQFVDLGDAVRAGQMIAQLDTRELELAVGQQRAALQQELARLGLNDENADIDERSTSQVRLAEATFAEAKIRLDRVRQLAEEGVVPKQTLDEQQARFDVSEAALRSARETVHNIRATIAARKSALALAEKKLADASITAPVAGFIRDRQISEGQYLKPNSPVVTIVQNSPLKLRVEVPENAIGSVRSGGAVRFSVDAFPDRTFEGRISRLSPAVNPQSRTLTLEALVNNADGLLKPGFFARATIQTNRRDKALVVPAGAIFSFAGIEKIFVVQEGKVTERIVRSGSRLDNFVEIVEGITEGELVATSNLGSLQQGREVSVR